MRAIFISYRRDDTEGYAGRLFRDLRDRFGKDAVFMDVTGIEPGRDFRRVIEDKVASCGVLLAMIGKAWLTVTDEHGKRRIEDPNDFVRLETASALKRDIPVIPVLVQQAEMLREEQLPDGLKDLAFRNSVELTHARWESDVELLIAALSRYVDPSAPAAADAAGAPPVVTTTARASGYPPWVIAPLAMVALGGVAYVAWDRLGPASEPTQDAAPAAASATAASATTTALAPLPASAASPLVASAPAPLAPAPAPLVAAASAPLVAAASAPRQTPRPAPSPVDAGVAKRAVADPVAPQAASARRVDRPVVAKAPAPAPAAAPATVAAAPGTGTPGRATPVEYPAAAPPPPAPVMAAAAPEAPPAQVAPARRDRSLELFGEAGSPSAVVRTIVIKPDMSYVNVTGGEVIRFEVGNKSFIWNFSGPRKSFDLAQVAPTVLDRKVTAYVADNPLYRRR